MEGGNPDGLWTDRRGGSLPLTHKGFVALIYRALQKLQNENYFLEVLGWDRGTAMRTDDDQAIEFFTMRLGDPWPVTSMQLEMSLGYESDDKIFDLLELLHREVVSEYGEYSDEHDQEAGRAELRAAVNPILARRDPPLELLASGHIVERGPEPFRRLAVVPNDVRQP